MFCSEVGFKLPKSGKSVRTVIACVDKCPGIVDAFDVQPQVSLAVTFHSTECATVPIGIGSGELYEIVQLVFAGNHTFVIHRLLGNSIPWLILLVICCSNIN